MVPKALQQFSKYDGHWIAAPVNVHSTNWLWINKAALDKAGGKAPENWDELIVMLDNFKGQGLTFRHWDQQLREPLLLASPLMLVSVSPQQGFLHQRTPLDTLGYDEPDSQCKLNP